MKGMQHVRGGEDLRSLHVARVRSTLSLNRQQHFLEFAVWLIEFQPAWLKGARPARLVILRVAFCRD